MKFKMFLMLTAVMMMLLATSCFLFPTKVTTQDTKDFVNDFESMMADPAGELDGPNGQMTAMATNDFFAKGGTTKGILLPFVKVDLLRRVSFSNTKLLFGDQPYGTYEYDAGVYDFVLTDANNPANGYKFMWTFTDTTVSPNEDHTADFLFDSLEYYSGDSYEETPTNMYAALEVDGDALMYLKLEANYTTLSDESFVPTMMDLRFEITDEEAVELGFTGHEVGDTTVLVDSLRLKEEDILNDTWMEYTAKQTGAETGTFTMENQEGWFLTIDTEAPVEVDNTYTSTGFTGEISKGGTHAADLEGTIWSPEDYTTHRSVMYITYADGTVDTMYFNDSKK